MRLDVAQELMGGGGSVECSFSTPLDRFDFVFMSTLRFGLRCGTDSVIRLCT